MEKKEFVCKYCYKRFPSGKSLGGHIRIHSPRSSSVDFNGKNNKKKSLVDQREITPPPKQQQQCRVCRKSFSSLKALANHMDCHNNYEVGEEKMMVMDTHQSASETTTATSSGHPTMMIKRSKKQHSTSDESFSIVTSSSDSGIVQGAKDLMLYHLGRKDYNLAVNSMVPESSENNSELSSGELLKKTDKISVDVGDDADDSDDVSSDDDYFMNGPKKSDSGISFGGSLRNAGVGSGFNSSFSYGDELGAELGKRKRVTGDTCADTTNSKIHRSSDGMAKKASGANRNSKGHVCPICLKVFSSGPALGGHKRSHTIIANQEQRIKHKAPAGTQFDLNLPAEENDDE